MSFKDIKSVIGDYIQSEDRLRNNLQNYHLESVWKSVAGETVAKYTSKIAINGTKLIIYINSAPLKQELMYSKASLITRVNAQLQYQDIDDIIIK